MKKGLKNQALETFKEVLKIDPQNKQAHYQIGVIYHNESAMDKAITSYENALVIDPNYFDAAVSLGDVYYYEKNNLGRAYTYYSKAMTIDMNSAYCKKMIRKIKKEKGN
jgi:superkiller protein 3